MDARCYPASGVGWRASGVRRRASGSADWFPLSGRRTDRVCCCLPAVDTEGRKLKGGIQRSTETGLAVEMPSRTIRQASHESIEDSMNSYGSEGK